MWRTEKGPVVVIGRNGLPTVICIDVEPDQRAPGLAERSSWDGFELMAEQLRTIRSDLADATGSPAHFSWFIRMDPQIALLHESAGWAAHHYRTLFREFADAGDEIGLHIHPWRWDPREETWVVDFAGVDFGQEAVRCGFAAFEEALGRRCNSIRFGDHWLNGTILALAFELGAQIDLTTEPGVRPLPPTEHHLGQKADFAGAPTAPYRPSLRSPVRSSRRRTRKGWIIPLTTVQYPLRAPVYQAPARRDSDGPSGTPPPAKASNAGWIDVADDELVAGWAYDADAPDRAVTVMVRDRDRIIGVAPAIWFRPDLKAAGIGDGRHAFSLLVGDRLRDGSEHLISATVRGATYSLEGGPVPVRGVPRPRTYRTLDLGFPVIGPVLDEVLANPGHRRHLALVVRSSSAGEIFVAVLDHLIRHPRARRLRVVTPHETCELLSLA